MFSIVNSLKAGSFRNWMIALLACVLLCGALCSTSLAVRDEPTPYVVPGDADGVNGYRGFDQRNVPALTADDPVIHAKDAYVPETSKLIRLCRWLLDTELYLLLQK